MNDLMWEDGQQSCLVKDHMSTSIIFTGALTRKSTPTFANDWGISRSNLTKNIDGPRHRISTSSEHSLWRKETICWQPTAGNGTPSGRYIPLLGTSGFIPYERRIDEVNDLNAHIIQRVLHVLVILHCPFHCPCRFC